MKNYLKTIIDLLQKIVTQTSPKRKVGRPKGSKNKKK